MAFIHKQLLRRGLLDDILPDALDICSDKEDREAARADTEARLADDKVVRREVDAAIARLQELNRKNHYGESLRRAFGGR